VRREDRPTGAERLARANAARTRRRVERVYQRGLRARPWGGEGPHDPGPWGWMFADAVRAEALRYSRLTGVGFAWRAPAPPVIPLPGRVRLGGYGELRQIGAPGER
jgi:hypothetical protein